MKISRVLCSVESSMTYQKVLVLIRALSILDSCNTFMGHCAGRYQTSLFNVLKVSNEAYHLGFVFDLKITG